ncbi:HMG (High mobility group) box domain-containing protein [Spironucleus salmonicida]|uniref:HMG (High mobility group) box domain-containing protein n=1 Tax=Spironucleus salmonicida TaxID=348837 RepID=V6LTS6_9EUKA|nr:HMG (High mobility group) box domain-containing protein [Spironucleus salmonicida]|eukprot:EST48000.1 HMG (high mobility group) box domain-containing protein [Spironucleus salmonicida]
MNRPQRPQTPYFQYSNDFKHQNPTYSAKQIAETWHQLPEETKKSFGDNFQAQYKQYQIEMIKFYEENPEQKQIDEEQKVVQRKQKSDAAKQNFSRLIYTVAHLKKFRESNREVQFSQQLLQMVHLQFNKLTEAEKVAWKDLWRQIDGEKKSEIQSYYDEWAK